MRFGAQTIELQHAPAWQRMNAHRESGAAARASGWVGTERAHAVLRQIKPHLSAQVRGELMASRGAMPEWLTKVLSIELAT